MARSRLACFAIACFAGACAQPAPIASGQLREVRDEPLPPFETHEDCVDILPGERIRYAFNADAPLAFSIRYREGKVLVMPLVREQVRRDEGEFTPLTAQHYCLVFEAGAQPAMLDYQVQLIRGDQARRAQ